MLEQVEQERSAQLNTAADLPVTTSVRLIRIMQQVQFQSLELVVELPVMVVMPVMVELAVLLELVDSAETRGQLQMPVRAVLCMPVE
jgi:uncharacterized protein (DUF983 family)